MVDTRHYAGPRDPRAMQELRLPSGYVARPVGDEDVPGRVMAHRAAFHPSRVSVDSYSAVRDAWPYRRGLDWCVVAPRGCIAGLGLGREPGACTFTPEP